MLGYQKIQALVKSGRISMFYDIPEQKSGSVKKGLLEWSDKDLYVSRHYVSKLVGVERLPCLRDKTERLWLEAYLINCKF